MSPTIAKKPQRPRAPKRGRKIYEGKAKIIYATSDKNLVMQYFKDDATAFNAQKRGTIANKGVVNNRMSTALLRMLEERGVPTHFVEQLDERTMLTKKLEIIPVEVVVRNVVAGSLAKRLGKEEGTPLPRPIVEFYYKDDALGDPLVNDDHLLVIKAATPKELVRLRELGLEVNKHLRPFFRKRGVTLVDFKLEFGRYGRKVLLGDEISPDTCRFWDQKTGEKLDKDRFRRDLGNVEGAYEEMLRRTGA